jgi:hypothetical protein
MLGDAAGWREAATAGLILCGGLAFGEASGPSVDRQRPGTFVWRGYHVVTSEPAVTWDARHDVFLAWGGHHLGHEQCDDVWAFSPKTLAWTLMPQTNAPRAGCLAHQLGYDERSGRLLVFGDDGEQAHGWMPVTVQGFNRSLPALYDYAANTWTPMRPVPYPPGGVRQSKGMVYHPWRDVNVLVGGKHVPCDTWLYDAHRNEWRELHPENPPEEQYGHVLAVHPDTGEILMVTRESALWVLSLERNAWRRVNLPDHPPALFQPWFGYDPHAGAFVLLGSDPKALKDPLHVWTLDKGLQAWKRVQLPSGDDVPGREKPIGALGFMCAYSPEENIYLICGGEFGLNRFHTWTFRLAATRPRSIARAPRLPPVRPGPPAPSAPAVGIDGTNMAKLTLPSPRGDARGFVVERAPVRTKRVENSCKRVQTEMEFGTFETISSAPFRGAVYTNAVALAPADAAWRFEQPPNPICVVYPKTLAPEPRWNPLAVYAYRIRQVDAAGTTSGPSPWVLTLPDAPDTPAVEAPPPEDPRTGIVALSWPPARRQNIVGYRVYCQKVQFAGPLWGAEWVVAYHADPQRWALVSRDLVRETRFVDDSIPGGNGRRRYYVSAVDAFGQEGPPSTGAWAYRPVSFALPGPLTNVPHARIPELDAGARIDGVLDDPPWQKAFRCGLRYLDGRTELPSQPTEVRMFTHNGWLYVSGTCREDNPGEMLVHTNWPHDCNFLWMDDTLEFAFLLNANAEGPIHHLMFSPAGVSHDAYGPLGAFDKKAWNPTLERAVSTGVGEWRLEFRIRLAEFHGFDPSQAVWRGNVFRNRQQSPHRNLEETAWAPPCFSEPNVPARYGYLEFAPWREPR